ncbi:MAG: hypothetical protein WDM90_10235 [Ferruginibacter sp.]
MAKKVNDLLNVDYDAVAMLNVSATQELAKQLKQSQNKIEQLQAENNQAKKDNAELKKMMADMQAQLSLINKKAWCEKINASQVFCWLNAVITSCTKYFLNQS